MVLRVAVFELRQQLRGHVFWVVFAISALMVSGSIWIDELRVGVPGDGLRNGAAAVARTYLVWSLFYMFTAAAFVSDAALRDQTSGFAPIVEATPAQHADLLLGRFAGAFAAVAFCFLSVPAALALGPYAPWIAPGTVGPFRLSAHLFAFAELALPNLFMLSAAFFVLSTATRSLSAALLVAVVLLVLYGVAGSEVAAVLEPFGFVAYEAAVGNWSQTARDVRVPELAGALLLNRVVWIGVGGALVAALLTMRPRPAWRVHPKSTAHEPTVATSQARSAPLRFTAATSIVQFVARTRFEVGRVVSSPVFAILLVLGIANAGAALWATDTSAAGPTVQALAEAFRLVPTVVALFFAGELVWDEHERRVHSLIGASPMPDAAYLLPKLLAIALVLAALAVTGAVVAAALQAARGHTPGVGALLRLHVLPAAYDWSLVAALALFFQALAPNKVAGWGYMVLYLIASLALQRLGFNDPLYRYGRYPGWPLPEPLSGAENAELCRAYWGAFAVVLTVFALGLIGRGEPDTLRTRLRRLPGRLRGLAGTVGIGAAGVFVVLLQALLNGR
jgi:ABC-type transport system involved in multi-copper enzyme maturation permease subunit